MLKPWQFNVLFFVGVGSAILLLVGPEFHLHVSENPTALTGVGAILTYILTQKTTLVQKPSKHRKKTKEEKEEEADDNES